MSQVLTYDTVVGRELGLQDRKTALRNLRPGTRLSWPEGDLSRKVLRELLSLPESIDVLQWLEAERGAAVALLAIEQSLDMAGMMYGAQNRIVSGMLTSEQERQVHQSLQDKYGAMHGALLRSDEDWGAPKQRGDIVDGPSEHRHLVDALTRLRRKIGLPTETSPSRSQVDPGPHTLLADLLRLPDSADPVRWTPLLRQHGAKLRESALGFTKQAALLLQLLPPFFLAMLVHLCWGPVAQSLVRPLPVVELQVGIAPSSPRRRWKLSDTPPRT